MVKSNFRFFALFFSAVLFIGSITGLLLIRQSVLPPSLSVVNKQSNLWDWLTESWFKFLAPMQQKNISDRIIIKGEGYEFSPIAKYIGEEVDWENEDGFDSLLPKHQNFINRLVNSGITKEELEQNVKKHLTKELSLYWDELRKEIEIWLNLKENYKLQAYPKESFDKLSEIENYKAKSYGNLEESEKMQIKNLVEKKEGSINTIRNRIKKLVESKKKELWQELKKKKELLINVITEHQMPSAIRIKEREYQLHPFVDSISQDIKWADLNENQQQLIDQFFDGGVTVSKLNSAITSYEKESLANYWDNLRDKLNTFENLQKKDRSLFWIKEKGDYSAQLNWLMKEKTKTIKTISSKARVSLEMLFKEVTIADIEKLEQLANANKTTDNNEQTRQTQKSNIPNDKTSTSYSKIASKNTKTKAKTQTKTNNLAIGLGVGLGIPLTVGGGGLVYWLVRKYKKQNFVWK